jgi:hypothetical protein
MFKTLGELKLCPLLPGGQNHCKEDKCMWWVWAVLDNGPDYPWITTYRHKKQAEYEQQRNSYSRNAIVGGVCGHVYKL